MASDPYDTYIAGTAVRWRGLFEQEVLPATDPPTYAAYDPTPGNTVVAAARHQSGTEIEKVYTVDSQVTRQAVGDYLAIIPLLLPGFWHVGFRGPTGWVGSRRVLMTDANIP